MNIVRALRDWSKRSHLTSSVFQLTALRDKLNETLAEATRLALSPPKEDVPISNWPQKCFCTSTGGHALGKPKYLDITLRSADNGVVARSPLFGLRFSTRRHGEIIDPWASLLPTVQEDPF